MLIKLRKMRKVFDSVRVGDVYLNDGLKIEVIKKLEEKYFQLSMEVE